MSEKGLTNISLKKINKSKVYQYIYRKKKTSKQQIVQELQRVYPQSARTSTFWSRKV